MWERTCTMVCMRGESGYVMLIVDGTCSSENSNATTFLHLSLSFSLRIVLIYPSLLGYGRTPQNPATKRFLKTYEQPKHLIPQSLSDEARP